MKLYKKSFKESRWQLFRIGIVCLLDWTDSESIKLKEPESTNSLPNCMPSI